MDRLPDEASSRCCRHCAVSARQHGPAFRPFLLPLHERILNMKNRKKTIWIVGGILLALLVIALIGCLLFSRYLDQKLDKISYTPTGTYAHPQFTEEEKDLLEEESRKEKESGNIIETSDAPPEGDVFSDKDVINILLLGTDERLPYGHDPGRADAIQVISLNLSNGEVKLISFERGIMVPVPDHDIDLLTHAFRWAGPEYMLSLFRDYFLMDMTGYAHVDFESFIEIIDVIGGIDVELTQAEAWAIDRQYQFHRHLVEGVNHLDGELALKYCRLRSIDSNWHRVERQRHAIQAAMNKVKGLSLKELDALADTVLPLIHTNLSKEQISALLLRSPKFLGSTAEQMTVPLRIPGEPARCDFQFEAERIRELIYGPEG